jgi:hypothetical protein
MKRKVLQLPIIDILNNLKLVLHQDPAGFFPNWNKASLSADEYQKSRRGNESSS